MYLIDSELEADLTTPQYHAVQFYSDEQSLARTVARFLGEGLDARQPGLVIATPSHTSTIVEQLAERGLNVNELRRTGELQFVDAQKMLDLFMVDGSADHARFKKEVGDLIEGLCAGLGPRPVRAYGELVDLLWQDGNADAAIKLEMLWNQLAEAYDFSLLCGYAFGHFYKETRDPRYQDVRGQHSHVIDTVPELSV